MSVKETRLILNRDEVARYVGLSKATIWRLERDGKFPRRVRLSTRRVGYHLESIQKWIEERQRM